MATTSLNVILVALVMTPFLCGTLGRWDDDEKDELSNKEIRESLEVLANEIKELKNDVKELKTKEVPCENQGVKNSSKKQVVKNSSENKLVKNISVLSASRKFLTDGQVCFTVQYKAVGNLHTTIRWMLHKDYKYEYIHETFSNEILKLPPNVQQSSVVVPPGNTSHVISMFGTNNEWVSLYLQNAWEGDLTQTDIEMPIMDVSPNPEFVYEPGHNISIKVTSPKKQERRDPGNMFPSDNHRAEYKLVLPGGTKLITKYNSEEVKNFFTKTTEKKFLDKVQFGAVMNTAEYPVSGIMEFTTATTDPTSLAATIEYNRQFVLRPSTQRGPFPEGQLFASGYEWKPKNQDGEYETYCSFGESCYVYCDFWGDDVRDIKLYEILNGNVRPLPMTTLGGEDSEPYRITGQFEIDANPGTPSPVTYNCVGSNARGREVSRAVVLYVGKDVEIVKNETSMETYENGTALITCTATGLPLPKVSIDCNEETKPDVIYQSDDVISVSVQCHGMDRYSWVMCRADNSFKSVMQSLSNRPEPWANVI